MQLLPHLCSHPDELLGLLINIAHHKSLVQVAMVAFVVGCHINIDDVPVLQGSLIRNAVADHLQNHRVAHFPNQQCSNSMQSCSAQYSGKGGAAAAGVTSFTDVQTDFGKLQ